MRRIPEPSPENPKNLSWKPPAQNVRKWLKDQKWPTWPEKCNFFLLLLLGNLHIEKIQPSWWAKKWKTKWTRTRRNGKKWNLVHQTCGLAGFIWMRAECWACGAWLSSSRPWFSTAPASPNDSSLQLGNPLLFRLSGGRGGARGKQIEFPIHTLSFFTWVDFKFSWD